MIGPAAYDVVSLTQDARRDLSPGLEETLVQRYLDARPDLEAAAYWRSHALLGAQRSLKIFGIFTRQALDHGRDLYLPHLARLWRYVDLDLGIADSAGRALGDWLRRHVPAAVRDGCRGRRADVAGAAVLVGVCRWPRTFPPVMVLAIGAGALRPVGGCKSR